MNEQIHLTKKERSVYFYKLLMMYGGGVLLLALIIFWNASGSRSPGNAADWKKRHQEHELVNRQQLDAIRIIDSMNVMMNTLKGDARQTFLEKDLQTMARQLGMLYSQDQTNDQRALCFVQASSFMTLRLQDVQTLNKTLANISLFEKQLNECRSSRNNQ